MSIQLKKPYKIIPLRQKRYEEHYQVPAGHSIVIPLKQLGEEFSCDIRWQDTAGDSQVIHNAVFVVENLEPLNALMEDNLYALWKQYYGEPVL
jgi:hypothetical protein